MTRELQMAVTIRLDTGGRRGKTVTVISNIQHNPRVIGDLETELKRHCGAGGTSYGKTIEIQGDHVEKIREYLSGKGFAVK